MSNEIGKIRIEKIEECLRRDLMPTSISITDDSHLHAGHAGAQSGKGHFSLEITSEKFIGLSAIKRHQLIYQSLEQLMESDIHALAIKANLPS